MLPHELKVRRHQVSALQLLPKQRNKNTEYLQREMALSQTEVALTEPTLAANT